MNPFEYLSDDDIRTAIRNANGLRKSLFLPEAAFQNLLRTQINRLKLPSLQCAHLIHEQLRRLIHIIRIQQIQRFQHLSIKIQSVMDELLSRSLSKTEEMIKNLIEIELGYINTNHPDFIDIISLVKTHPQNKGKESLQDKLNLSFQSEAGRMIPTEEIEQDQHDMFKFQKKKNPNNTLLADSQILDGKLRDISQQRQKKQVNPKKQQMKQTKNNGFMTLDSFYTSYGDQSLLPRYKLPEVPSVIKVGGNLKLRQKTQTEMIKKLIVSYFNVVKKNVNDSIPKTIVTFLVNHCKNACQKILVNNLYVQSEFDDLLNEKDYIVTERDRLRKQIAVLKECLDLINSIDSRLGV